MSPMGLLLIKQFFLTCTEPDPPTDVKCPDNPLDVSLHISWEAPTNANGIIQHYKIVIPSRNPSIILTSSNVTSQIVDGLLQGMTLQQIFNQNTLILILHQLLRLV